jgi:predicted permease
VRRPERDDGPPVRGESRKEEDARREVDEEVRLHIELRVRQLVADGMEPSAAEQEAWSRFGRSSASLEALYRTALERNPQVRAPGRWNAWLQDLHYAVRSLVRAPGVPSLVVLVLALGIGANVTIFSAAYGILERPLPVPDAERLARVYHGRHSPLAYQDFLHLAAASQSFEALTAERLFRVGITDGDVTEPLDASLVSANYFEGLGVRAQHGRVFTGGAGTDVGPVVVLANAYWRSRFGADPSVVGRTLRIAEQPFTVIGVADASWTSAGAWRPDVFVPLTEHPALLGVQPGEWNGSVYVTGRLSQGSTHEQAGAEIAALASQLPEAAQAAAAGQPLLYRVTHARGITEEVRGPAMAASAFLLALVGLVLLTACANVANLLLARAAMRRKESAIRLALGVSRARLVRQLLAESVLLALAAGACAVVIAALTTRFLANLLPADMPLQLTLTPDRNVLAFAGALSLATGLVFGLAPALRSAGAELHATLREDDSRGGYRRSRLRAAFLVAQVCMSTVLLTGAGLFARSLLNAREMDPGFAADGVVTLPIDVSLRRYDEERGRAYFDELLERLAATPGVRHAALANLVPLSGSNRGAPVQPATSDAADPSAFLQANYNTVTPGYFATLGLPLLAGRDFRDEDGRGSPSVTIVNETAARLLWPDAPAVGKVLRIWDDGMPELTVVGVAADSKYNALGEGPTPYLYLPLAQDYRADMIVHARVSDWTASAVREAAAALDPTLPLSAVRAMEADMAFALAGARIGAGLLGAFAMLAVLVAAIGVYGVTAYMVARRTSEIGIRTALGATRGGVLRLMMWDTLRLAAAGLVLGLIGGAGLGRLVATQLYGVGALDAPTFLIVPALVLSVAGIAALLPAGRAVARGPLPALRRE